MRRKLLPITLIMLFIVGLSPLLSSAGVGDTWGEADTAVLGENRVTLAEGEQYWFYFDADPAKYYEFSLTGPEDADFYLTIDDENLDPVDSTGWNSGSESAFAGYEDGFYLEVYASWNGGEVVITITEIVPPQHASIESADGAVLGGNEGSISRQGIEYYFAFNSTVNQWYELTLNYATPNHMEVDVRGSDNMYIETFHSYSYEAPDHSYFIGNGETVYFVVSSYEGTGDFSLSVAEMDKPAHYNREGAQEASLGNNTGEHIANGIPYYFKFLGSSDQWYNFELQSDTTSETVVNVNYEMRIEPSSGYENTYAYGEPPVSAIRKGSVTSLYIRVTLDVGIPSEFSLVITEIDAPEHAEQSNAKSATLGENSGELIAQSIDYWFVFEDADPDKFYAFSVDAQEIDNYFNLQVIGPGGDYLDYDYYGNTVVISGEGTYYIRVRTYGQAGAFTLTIEETVEPQDVIELRYNSMLQAGDTFSWKMSAVFDGQPANGTSEDFPFTDGSIVELEILKDAPTVDIDNVDYYPGDSMLQDIFEIRVDGEVVDDYDFLPPQVLILPAEIVLENNETLSLSEYSTMPQYSDIGIFTGISDTEIVGDEVVMLEDISQDGENIHYEMRYDTFIGHLTYLDISIDALGESMSLGFTLLDAPAYEPEKPQIFGLPVNPVGIFLALLAIPVIRRKYRAS